MGRVFSVHCSHHKPGSKWGRSEVETELAACFCLDCRGLMKTQQSSVMSSLEMDRHSDTIHTFQINSKRLKWDTNSPINCFGHSTKLKSKLGCEPKRTWWFSVCLWWLFCNRSIRNSLGQSPLSQIEWHSGPPRVKERALLVRQLSDWHGMASDKSKISHCLHKMNSVHSVQTWIIWQNKIPSAEKSFGSSTLFHYHWKMLGDQPGKGSFLHCLKYIWKLTFIKLF